MFTSPTAWLLSRFFFDVIPLRILPTIIVSTVSVYPTLRALRLVTHILLQDLLDGRACPRRVPLFQILIHPRLIHAGHDPLCMCP